MLNVKTLKATAVKKNESLTKQAKAITGKDDKSVSNRKRCETHAKCATNVSKMSDAAVQVAIDMKALAEPAQLDAFLSYKASRECKNKSIAMFEAIAGKRHASESALDKAMHFFASSQSKVDYDQKEIQKQLNDKGPTQAGYIRSFLIYWNIATKVKGGFTLDRKAPLFVALVKNYPTAKATPKKK